MKYTIISTDRIHVKICINKKRPKVRVYSDPCELFNDVLAVQIVRR